LPRLDRLPQINRNNLLMLPVQVNDIGAMTARSSRAAWR
jgi:hypothetical protein